MTRLASTPPRSTRRHVLGVVIVVAVMLAGAACGDDDDATIPLADWVGQFDQACADVATELSAPGLTDEEFTDISLDAIAEIRAIGTPDEMADTAEDLIDAIEAGSQQDLDDATVEDLDQRVLDAMTSLGVSPSCIRGVPGE